MRHFTIFLGIAVAATAILAAPSSSPVGFSRGNVRMHRIHRESKSFDNQVKSIISLRYLAKIGTRDSFSDLIERELGQSPTDFLKDVDGVFKVVDERVKEGVEQLDAAFTKAGAGVKSRIAAIKRNAIAEVFKLTERFLVDLGRVLLGMPSTAPNHYDPIADVIRSILCKTLQQFVENISKAFEDANALLLQITNDVLDLADEASPEVATILRNVANSHLYRGRVEIVPMLDKLSNLLNYRMTMMKTFNIPLSESHEKRNLLDATVLSVFGFSAQTAAYQADVALSELIPLIESSRDELTEAVASSDQVQTKVIGIYDTSMNSFVEDVTPMYRSIIDLQGSGCNTTYVYDLMGSLPGIGVDYFTNYLQHETSQIESNLKSAFTEILEAASEGGEATVSRVSKVLEKQTKSLEVISGPLMETLKLILERPEGRKTEVQKVVRRLGGEDEEKWLESDGALYNRDALVHAVSNQLGFDVEEGATALRTSLQNVDDKLGETLIELDAILADHNVDVHSDILRILNETMIDVHVASQPMINVLLPFIPDGFRSNKHIALDIYTGIGEVDDIDEFIGYCAAAAKQIVSFMDIAMTKIKIVAGKATPEASEEIEFLLQTALYHTQAYMKPFIDVIRPILSPKV